MTPDSRENGAHRFLRLWDNGDVIATYQGRDLRFTDLIEVFTEQDRLRGQVAEQRAAVTRLTDEVDALNSSSDRAATAWHDMVAERDTWKGRALGLQDERDRFARELADAQQRVRVGAEGLQTYVEANSRSAAEADRLRDAWQQAWAERNEARDIAHRLIDRKCADSDNAEHLGLPALPDWLTADA